MSGEGHWRNWASAEQQHRWARCRNQRFSGERAQHRRLGVRKIAREGATLGWKIETECGCGRVRRWCARRGGNCLCSSRQSDDWCGWMSGSIRPSCCLVWIGASCKSPATPPFPRPAAFSVGKFLALCLWLSAGLVGASGWVITVGRDHCPAEVEGDLEHGSSLFRWIVRGLGTSDCFERELVRANGDRARIDFVLRASFELLRSFPSRWHDRVLCAAPCFLKLLHALSFVHSFIRCFTAGACTERWRSSAVAQGTDFSRVVRRCALPLELP